MEMGFVPIKCIVMLLSFKVLFGKRYPLLLNSLVAVNFIVILYAGLNFKDKALGNTALINKNGLILSSGSFAYVFIKNLGFEKKIPVISGLIVDLEIALHEETVSSKDILRVIFNNNVSDVYLFQWDNSVILSVGQDYNYSKKKPRLYSGVKIEDQKIRLQFSEGKIFFYVNGISRGSIVISDLSISSLHNLTFKIGNYTSHMRGWRGNIARFSVSYIVPGSTKSVFIVDYEFTKTKNKLPINNSGEMIGFELPDNPSIYDRELLSFKLFPSKMTWSIVYDLIINFIGFLPTGFLLLILTLNKFDGLLKAFLITVALGFFMSLFIEYVQSWLPMRHSSLRDVMINTFGVLAGAVLFLLGRKLCFYHKFRRGLN